MDVEIPSYSLSLCLLGHTLAPSGTLRGCNGEPLWGHPLHMPIWLLPWDPLPSLTGLLSSLVSPEALSGFVRVTWA